MPSRTVPKNSTPTPANGSPRTAIRATSPARMRSRVIINCWRGNKSASPDRAGPPSTGGRYVRAYAAAVRNADPVRAYTTKAIATCAN